ncbi:DUF3419 family protein [archaeon]|nr:DUF3419 family protein [archaeon]
MSRLITYENEERLIPARDRLWNSGFYPHIFMDGDFALFARIYAFTTENLAGYLPLLNLDNAKVLTVSGSGDQVINAYLQGAGIVDSFDLNIFSGIFTELKLKALQSLSFEEFKQFFLLENLTESGDLNKSVLDFKVYNELRANLSELAATTLDKMFEEEDNKGDKLRVSQLFSSAWDMNKLSIGNNLYLNSEEKFEQAKENVKEKQTKWVNCHITKLKTYLRNRKYDVILLSNISDYAKELFRYRPDYLQAFCDEVISPLTENLNPGGVICAAYVYDFRHQFNLEDDYRSQIDNPEIRQDVFKNLGIPCQEITFSSVMEGKKDGILLVGGKQK